MTFTSEDLDRLRQMYANLQGAPGVQLRADRAALRRAIIVLEEAQPLSAKALRRINDKLGRVK